jgi:hypothetical protein
MFTKYERRKMKKNVMNLNISLIIYCNLFLDKLLMQHIRLPNPETLSYHLTNKTH